MPLPRRHTALRNARAQGALHPSCATPCGFGGCRVETHMGFLVLGVEVGGLVVQHPPLDGTGHGFAENGVGAIGRSSSTGRRDVSAAHWQ